jgi:tRNA nucleotidyltransferase/poly(A) polymerase
MRFKNYDTFVNESIKRDMKLPKEVLQISELYQEANKKLFVVGGAVRDFLQNKTPKDFDLATDATPDESLAILKPHFKTMEVGKSFGVVIAVTPSGEEYEIATFRSDIGKGRRPEGVEFTSIDKDVLRRDLTINALFYDIQKGEVVDLVGGMEDLKKNRIRTVGNPRDRFEEDPLRKLRAVRFMARMGAELDEDTYEALKADPSLEGVSPERIRDEFLKILTTAKDLQHAVNALEDLGFIPYIFPGLRVETDEVVKGDPISTIALMLYDNSFTEVNKKLNKLTWTKDEVSAISFLIRLGSLEEENAYEMKRIQERSSLKDDPETVERFALRIMPKKLAQAFASYKITTSGDELEAQGFEGRALGEKMKEIETEKFAKHLQAQDK